MRSNLSIGILTALFLTILMCGTASADFLGIFGDRGIRGSGDMETRTFDLDKTNAVSIHGAFDLYVTFGKKQKISVTIDDNLWDNFEIKVKNGNLDLDWEDNCRPDSDCRIDLVLVELEEVSVYGACDANIDDYDGDSFSFNVRGAGDLEINGEVDDLEISISGAGDVDAEELIANHVDVSISGAGSGSVYAEKSIEARISGVGSLTYYGDPEEKSTLVSGMGSSKKR